MKLDKVKDPTNNKMIDDKISNQMKKAFRQCKIEKMIKNELKILEGNKKELLNNSKANSNKDQKMVANSLLKISKTNDKLMKLEMNKDKPLTHWEIDD